MSDTTNTSKNPEEENKTLTEVQAAEENTDLKTAVDDDSNEIITTTSETKVRHDTVK